MKPKIQLDLFTDNDELSLMEKELKALYVQHEKLRKNLFSRYNYLARLCVNLKEENEALMQRLEKLEKQQRGDLSNPTEDLLEKLFREAYLPQRATT